MRTLLRRLRRGRVPEDQLPRERPVGGRRRPQGGSLLVRVYADVVMSYEDFLRLDDSELADYIADMAIILDWQKEGSPNG